MDPTDIFGLPNISLLFLEILPFLVLMTALLYYFAYRPIRDRIRQDAT